MTKMKFNTRDSRLQAAVFLCTIVRLPCGWKGRADPAPTFSTPPLVIYATIRHSSTSLRGLTRNLLQ
jgi:hypothetical protein